MQEATSLANFSILQKLGEGSFGMVYKVKRLSDGKEYAMKKVRMNMLNEKEKENAVNEVRILASMQDPYIVSYKEAFFDESSSCLCIIMEFASGGDIQKKVNDFIKLGGSFSEKELFRCLIHMVSGLKTLHDMKILHRDLKCANIFLGADNNWKLGDLNVSKVAKKGLVYTQTGTPYYASPEVWRDEPYDMKSDIWSLGCVLYEMAALKPPFRGRDMQELFKRVQKGQFDKLPPKYTNDLFSVISACLQVSPAARPNCEQLLSNPKVQRYAQNMEILLEPEKDIKEARRQLLETIKLPKNLKLLKEKLPKSNYNPSIQPKAKEMENLYEKEPQPKELAAEIKGDVMSSRAQRILSAGVRRSDSQHAIGRNPQPELLNRPNPPQNNNNVMKRPPSYNPNEGVNKPPLVSANNAGSNNNPNNRYGVAKPPASQNIQNTPQPVSSSKRPPSNYVQKSYDQAVIAEKRVVKPASANLQQKVNTKEQILLSNDVKKIVSSDSNSKYDIPNMKKNISLDSNNKYDMPGPKVGTPSHEIMSKINAPSPQREMIYQQYSQMGAPKSNVPKAYSEQSVNKGNNAYMNYSPSNKVASNSPSAKSGVPRASSKDVGKQNNMAAGQNLSNNGVSKPSWWG